MNATHQRTRGCTRWLIILIAFLALFQFGAALRALQTPPEIAAQVSLPMPLEFVASTVWGILAMLVVAKLVRRSPRALRSVAWLLIGFIIYSVARLLIFARADYDRQRLPFLLVMAIPLLIVPIILVLQPAARQTENLHGRESQS